MHEQSGIADVVTQLDRLGDTSVEVVHDWHARTVTALLPELPGQAELRCLHLRAADGDRVTEAEWVAALEPALREIYQRAYDYDEAYATAAATARTYARANGFTEAETDEFAASYAELNTGANVRSFAAANAIANARAFGRAFASRDQQAYADCYPLALLQAFALAYSNTGELAERPDRLRAAYRRLSDGVAE